MWVCLFSVFFSCEQVLPSRFNFCLFNAKVHDGGPDELPEEAVQLPQAEPERGLPLPQHLRSGGLWQKLLSQNAGNKDPK